MRERGESSAGSASEQPGQVEGPKGPGAPSNSSGADAGEQDTATSAPADGTEGEVNTTTQDETGEITESEKGLGSSTSVPFRHLRHLMTWSPLRSLLAAVTVLLVLSPFVAHQLKKEEGHFWDGDEAFWVAAALTVTMLVLRAFFVSWNASQSAQRDLLGVDVIEGDLAGYDLSHRYLRNRDFSNARLSNVLAFKADFSGAKFRHTRLTKAKLIKGRFANADLDQAHCFKADFTGAILVGATFRGANCKGASFRKADLTGAVFDGALLHEADFTGATWEDPKRPTFRGVLHADTKWGELTGYPDELDEEGRNELKGSNVAAKNGDSPPMLRRWSARLADRFADSLVGGRRDKADGGRRALVPVFCLLLVLSAFFFTPGTLTSTSTDSDTAQAAPTTTTTTSAATTGGQPPVTAVPATQRSTTSSSSPEILPPPSNSAGEFAVLDEQQGSHEVLDLAAVQEHSVEITGSGQVRVEIFPNGTDRTMVLQALMPVVIEPEGAGQIAKISASGTGQLQCRIFSANGAVSVSNEGDRFVVCELPKGIGE